MQPLIFLAKEEIKKVQNVLDESLKGWIKDHTFTQEISIGTEAIRYADIPFDSGNIYTNLNGVQCVVSDKGFRWDEFIYSDNASLCPRNSSFNQILKHVKELFWSSVFQVNQFHVSTTRFSQSIDIYLRVHISNASAGAIELFAPHNFFASFIEKEKMHPVRISLDSRQDAVRNIRVPIKMVFAQGQIPFEDLVQIEVGKVLVSDKKIENNFIMQLCDTPVAKVSMGRKGANLAFILKGK